MPKVLVTNHGPASHGFYEASQPLDGGKPIVAEDVTMVRPGQSMVLHLPDEHMGENHIAPTISVLKDFTDADVAARKATHSAHAQAITSTSDDGARAAAGANAHPAVAVAAGDGPGPVADADDFDAMDDDQLRAHITTANGKAPHHMLGRTKLLALARGGSEDEAVG